MMPLFCQSKESLRVCETVDREVVVNICVLEVLRKVINDFCYWVFFVCNFELGDQKLSSLSFHKPQLLLALCQTFTR